MAAEGQTHFSAIEKLSHSTEEKLLTDISFQSGWFSYGRAKSVHDPHQCKPLAWITVKGPNLETIGVQYQVARRKAHRYKWRTFKNVFIFSNENHNF